MVPGASDTWRQLITATGQLWDWEQRSVLSAPVSLKGEVKVSPYLVGWDTGIAAGALYFHHMTPGDQWKVPSSTVLYQSTHMLPA